MIKCMVQNDYNLGFLSRLTHANLNFSITEIILGTPSDIPPIFDFYLTIAKLHIYCCKFQNSVQGIEGFAKRIADINYTEKINCFEKPQNTSIQLKIVNIRPNCSTQLYCKDLKTYNIILQIMCTIFIAGIKITKNKNHVLILVFNSITQSHLLLGTLNI